mmetsp:Transcript_18967/g.18236  ORF Transcript_18967/g.18236 Transcript_18967/m.18236 type:complete len:373 (-) Transcript_18967:34-1152(-)
MQTLKVNKVASCEVIDNQLQILQNEGFSQGLSTALSTTNCDIFPIRYWIVDNSYSMTIKDGHLILGQTAKLDDIVRTVPCTRYDEIKECVNYHARLSELIGAPTEFRLLNKSPHVPQVYTIGASDNRKEEDNKNHVHCTHGEMKNMLDKTKPDGLTPLTAHVCHLRSEIQELAPMLQQKGQKVVIVIATDGLPVEKGVKDSQRNKDNFLKAMRSLEGLPVWIVIRLCTDDHTVVNFYNDLDEQLELSLEVLDDFESEALEVYEYNRWLNYALPIHRLRELGFYDRVFDLIDERALTKSELRQFFILLFGEEHFDSVPDPSIDWMGFVSDIERIMKFETPQWNPVKKRVMPWIDMYQLHKIYGNSSDCQCTIL